MSYRSLPYLLVVTLTPWLGAQIKSPAERLRDLEERLENVDDLEKRIKELEDKIEGLESDEEESISEGFLTLANEHFRLAGKLELGLIDSESERDPVVGFTDEPDPHFEIDVFRLYPRIDLNRDVSIRGQLDFKPRQGRVTLKEMTVRFQLDPVWWFESDTRLGLDDRFIRMQRDTENYPLIGNAFWRDETLAFWWTLRFGDKDGPPQETDAGEDMDDAGPEPSPFDFGRNLGELLVHFSVGHGYTLDGNEVGFDRAGFNDLVQDDRNVDSDLSIREIGVGLGYRRSFEALGELEVLGFYYNDELSSTSQEFLQQELTVRDPATGTAVAGYGDSLLDSSYRYGVGGELFFPAETLYGDLIDTRGSDGLRIKAQWIEAKDGALRRNGWFVQGSYRFSFPKRLIMDRYFRSIEPLVRYGELDVDDVDPTPDLPGTWDREALLLGFNTYITNDIVLRVEYTLHDETTGAGPASPGPSSVDNNELIVQLQIRF